MSNVTYGHTASHLRPALSIGERKVAVANAFNVLTSSGLKIDMLVATGISGIVFGTSLADMMNLPLAIVRKMEHPQSCSGKDVEGPDIPLGCLSWVFVDDLISSGATYRRVMKAMIERYNGHQILAGIFLYKDWCCSEYGVKMIATDYTNKLTAPVFLQDGRKYN